MTYKTTELTVELLIGTGRRALRTEGGSIVRGYDWAAAVYPKTPGLVAGGELVVDDRVLAAVAAAVQGACPTWGSDLSVAVTPAGRFSDGFLVGVAVDPSPSGGGA